MATYLLKCSDEQMAAWKAAAADAGYSFAEWLRATADARVGSAVAETRSKSFPKPQIDEVVLVGHSPPTERRLPAAAPPKPADAAQSVRPPERVFRGPDPKPSSRKRK